jgi:hypothetical protein
MEAEAAADVGGAFCPHAVSPTSSIRVSVIAVEPKWRIILNSPSHVQVGYDAVEVFACDFKGGSPAPLARWREPSKEHLALLDVRNRKTFRPFFFAPLQRLGSGADYSRHYTARSERPRCFSPWTIVASSRGC